jgi:aminoglycoside phosphotransferase (APT) family kinase protein
VFALTIGDRQDPLIVKTRPDDPQGVLLEEAWAVSRARDTGVPVPEVVFSGSYKHEGKLVTVLVEDLAPGNALTEAQNTLSPEALIEAYREMGRTLARLHEAQLGGFWKRQHTGGWDFNTWEAMMASTLKDRRAEHKLLGGAGLSGDEAAKLFASIERYAAEFPCHSPALCHGDYLPEHVFFDRTGQITGVIDFGFYFGGDPVSDLAVSKMDMEPWAFDALLEGYAVSGSLAERFDEHLHLSLLTMQAGFLFHHLSVPGRPNVDRYMDGLRSTLEWLEEHAA